MADYNFTVTDIGKAAIAACVSERSSLILTRIAMGNGTYSGTNEAAMSMQTEVKSLDITRISRNGNISYVHTVLLYSDVQSEFQWREVGLFARDASSKEFLLGYGYAGNKGDWITPGTSATTKRISLAIAASNEANITALLNDSDNFPAKATETQAETGTDNMTYMTPAAVQHVLPQALTNAEIDSIIDAL